MFKLHKKITSFYGRVFVLGDVHGNFNTLIRLLDKIEYDPRNDLLISLGDLIDRGPESLACLMYFLDNSNRYALAGNHEELMVDAIANEMQGGTRVVWENEGGDWHKKHTKEMLSMLAKRMCKNLYYCLTVETKDGTTFGLTHGDNVGKVWSGLEIERYSKAQLSQLLWVRNRARPRKYGNYKDIEGIDFTIHGHTPKEEPYQNQNSIFIDTGAGFKDGNLTCIELNTFAKTKALEESCFSVPSV